MVFTANQEYWCNISFSRRPERSRMVCSSKPVALISGSSWCDSQNDESRYSSWMILLFISSVALLVKVTARMCLNCPGLESIRRRYSCVRLNVLPEPADARITVNFGIISIDYANYHFSLNFAGFIFQQGATMSDFFLYS